MSVVQFPKSKAPPRRISQQELESLRWSAEINALRDGSTKAERDLVAALAELQDRRWSDRNV